MAPHPARLDRFIDDEARARGLELAPGAARELADKKIRVLHVAPGAIATPINKWVLDNSEARHAVEEAIQTGRIGNSDEIAAAVAWHGGDETEKSNAIFVNCDRTKGGSRPNIPAYTAIIGLGDPGHHRRCNPRRVSHRATLAVSAEHVADHDLRVSRARRHGNVAQLERPGLDFLLGDERAVDIHLDARRRQRRSAKVQRRITDEVRIEIEIASDGHSADQRRRAEKIGRGAGIAHGPSPKALALIDGVAAQEAHEIAARGARTRRHSAQSFRILDG